MLTGSRLHSEIKTVNDERTWKKLQPTHYNAVEQMGKIKENKSIVRSRVPHGEQSGYFLNTRDTNLSQNLSLKSRYCSEELRKHEGEYSTKSGKKINSSKKTPQTKTEPEVKRNENSCDVTFLRKLLAMNKKEELILNRKLAKLVLEEEFGLSSEGNSFGKNLFSNSPMSSFNSKRENNVALKKTKLTNVNDPSESIISKQLYKNTNTTPRTQYDLNGRRIYYDSDNYDDSEDEDRTSTAKYTSGSEDESSNPSVNFTAGRSKTYINTTTVIQTKSDITCDSVGRRKTSSRRNSMTSMNQPVLEKKEHRVRRNVEEGGEEEGKYKKCLFTKVDASGRGPTRERRESSPGDGVQNVVVHCCEVARDNLRSEPKRKVLKVWNFNDIPKIKPGKLESSSGQLQEVPQLRESIEDDEVIIGKDDKFTRTTSATKGKRKCRPNIVC